MSTLTPNQIRRKKKKLAKNLRNAAELEHQFTCMYLFAAFSLKKDADASFSLADVEVGRRWASVIYMIARQEMEHLAIVNQLLAAIGEPPYFCRRNIPYYSDFFRSADPTLPTALLDAKTVARKVPCPDEIKELCDYLQEFYPDLKFDHKLRRNLKKYANGDRSITEKIENELVSQLDLKACDLPFLFTHFDLTAARRYTVMESPFISNLVLTGQLEIARDLVKWGFKNDKGKCPCVLPPYWQEIPEGMKGNVQLGDIERYYETIKKEFEKLGDEGFVPPYAERQVNILSEYNIYIFPINDLASAKNGIELIIKQGEAVGSSPGFDSHFRHFYDIAQEYGRKLGEDGKCGGKVSYKKFQPFFNVLPNPQRSDIKDEFVLELFDLFNFGYRTMVYCLNGLYGWYSNRTEYPFLTNALRDIIFAPTMTLFIRAIGELLVLLPSGTYHQETGEMFRAAPNFDIEDDDNLVEQAFMDATGCKPLPLRIRAKANGGDWQHAEKYQDYLRLSFYTDRFEWMVAKIDKLSKDDALFELKVGKRKRIPKERAEHVRKCLVFAHQNLYRMTANLKRAYKDNTYQKFQAL
ncbi:MAG: ferritin-like domain-containing protein [Bacteroidota bacterium]